MNGREVFRFATHIINESVREVVSKAGLALSDVALVIPHQANQRILSAAARSLNMPEEMFYSNVERYGNTSAASIPIALCEAERDKRLKPNDHIVMIGFGGGLTWAAALIHWQVVAPAVPVGIGFRLSRGRREAEYIAAFWRTRIMRYFRRVESMLKGSVLQNEVEQVTRDQYAARDQKRPNKPPIEPVETLEKIEKVEKTDKIEKAVPEREKTS
jgi:3-oxoacyl-[acyl-carrier-protein] synthase-3